MARSARPGADRVTRIAITGTPGCGKTTLAELLRQRGEMVTTVEAIADAHGATVGHDDEDDAQIVDVEALEGITLPGHVVIDGHLSHHLKVDEIWVLRCDPDILRQRLEARGYHAGKVEENWEAECMDLVLQEALAAGPRVIQRDGTRRSPEELLSAFESIDSGPDIEPVDWSDRL